MATAREHIESEIGRLRQQAKGWQAKVEHHLRVAMDCQAEADNLNETIANLGLTLADPMDREHEAGCADDGERLAAKVANVEADNGPIGAATVSYWGGDGQIGPSVAVPVYQARSVSLGTVTVALRAEPSGRHRRTES